MDTDSRTVSFTVISVSIRYAIFHRGLRVADILRIGHEVGGYPAILEEFLKGGQVVERSSGR
jgi:hypothetical protein